MKNICFAGTFDPITFGHFWVVNEGLNIAENVNIYIAANGGKNPMFSAEERQFMIEESLFEYFGEKSERISVEIVEGEYTAQYAKENGIDYLIRGIRSTNDFDYENLLQQANTDVIDGAKTIFVMPPRDLGAVSSSFVKSFIGPKNWHLNVRKFVPTFVYNKLLESHFTKIWFDLVKDNEFSRQTLKFIIDSYNEKHRHYHNLSHIIALISEVNTLKNLSNHDKTLLLLAIIYHDIVYDVNSTDNEKRSADIFHEHCNHLIFNENVNAQDIDTVKKSIISTSHFEKGNELLEYQKIISNYLNNLDLSILGQSKVIYEEYAKNITLEYKDSKYGYMDRVKALQYLVNKINENSLYSLPKFQTKYNNIAKENMEREIHTLILANDFIIT